MTPILKKILGMNWVLVLVMYGLLTFGVFMIESAARHLPISDVLRQQFGGPGEYYAAQQRNWIVIGSVAYFAAALIDYRWIRWLGIPFYLVSMALVVAALLAGDDVHQLELIINFQPVQLGITSGILMIAWLIQDLARLHRVFASAYAKIAIIGIISAPPFLATVAMGDMGSALVWVPVIFVALFISGVPFRMMSFMALIGVGLLPLIYFIALPERGANRIDVWLRMAQGKEVDITDEAYAAHYVTMAVGKAGFKGAGWNAPEISGSLHSMGFVSKTTAHNDYIFAVIAEELGFRGGLLLISAFALLLIQCLFIAYYSRDSSGRLLVCMVVAMIFAHVFETIGMCLLLLPITGIPMPLVSYSGTFVVVCMFLLGLVQSVWVHRNRRPPVLLKKPAEEAAT